LDVDVVVVGAVEVEPDNAANVTACILDMPQTQGR
jgi:hypothetical protein